MKKYYLMRIPSEIVRENFGWLSREYRIVPKLEVKGYFKITLDGKVARDKEKHALTAYMTDIELKHALKNGEILGLIN